MSILGILAEAPATLSMVASRLGTIPANLSRHFRKLEAAGLIDLVETRTTARNVEKFYRAVAHAFVVEPRGLPPDEKPTIALSLLREEISLAISRSRAGSKPEPRGPREIAAFLCTARVAGPDLASFRARLEALVKDYGGLDDQAGQAYTLGMALFPAAASDRGKGTVRL